MVNSILVSKLIYTLLSEDESLNTLVDKKIFPLIAEHDTKFPFIVFNRDNITSNGCKDGYHEDNITFTVTAVSANYLDSLDIANKVRQILERRAIKSDYLSLYNVTLNSLDETYQDNAFVQRLSFSCTAQ